MNRTLFVVLPVAAVVAACGGSSGSSSVDTSTPASIAMALNKGGFDCSGFATNAQAVGPKASGDCQHGSDSITISTFDSAAQRDSMVKALGGSNDGTSVYGDSYLVTTPRAEDATAIAKVLGGTVK